MNRSLTLCFMLTFVTAAGNTSASEVVFTYADVFARGPGDFRIRLSSDGGSSTYQMGEIGGPLRVCGESEDAYCLKFDEPAFRGHVFFAVPRKSIASGDAWEIEGRRFWVSKTLDHLTLLGESVDAFVIQASVNPGSLSNDEFLYSPARGLLAFRRDIVDRTLPSGSTVFVLQGLCGFAASKGCTGTSAR